METVTVATLNGETLYSYTLARISHGEISLIIGCEIPITFSSIRIAEMAIVNYWQRITGTHCVIS